MAFRGRGRGRREGRREFEEKKEWIPKTKLGQQVVKGEIKDIKEILEKGEVILEPGIVDALVPNLRSEMVYIGGSPGKGGGTRRTATKRTARMHKSGRRFKLSAMVAVGNEDGILGLGVAKSKENRTAIEKAENQARMNVIIVRLGCGSWECGCGGTHSIPFKSHAKEGSVRVTLIPAPKGVGIVGCDAVKKIAKLAGIRDIWINAEGNTGARSNLVAAFFEALRNLNRTKGGL
ncbi:MAG: 30S ribosomal protein S5 [Candidatus Aenigmarchaeota archaeon]|nr:30S ribosomal protein S5 [Candidatus Aenigmarchaeota archaeon]